MNRWVSIEKQHTLTRYNYNYITQNTALVFRTAKIGHTVPVPNTHCRRTALTSLDVFILPAATACYLLALSPFS